MPPTLAFSYAHVDGPLRDQLEVHLAALKHRNLIAIWHDRRITAGSELDKTIAAQFDTAQVILLLISPEFIASDYCYGREVVQAMERHERGEARVIRSSYDRQIGRIFLSASCSRLLAMGRLSLPGRTSMKRF